MFVLVAQLCLLFLTPWTVACRASLYIGFRWLGKRCYFTNRGFPVGISGKEPACQCRRCRRSGFNPWVGRFPGEGNGNSLEYSCLENPMNQGAWWATVRPQGRRVEHNWSDLAYMHHKEIIKEGKPSSIFFRWRLGEWIGSQREGKTGVRKE